MLEHVKATPDKEDMQTIDTDWVDNEKKSKLENYGMNWNFTHWSIPM